MACPVLSAAALAADLPHDRASAIDAFGRTIGIAFQIKDDILDVEGDTAVIGKQSGADQRLDLEVALLGGGVDLDHPMVGVGDDHHLLEGVEDALELLAVHRAAAELLEGRVEVQVLALLTGHGVLERGDRLCGNSLEIGQVLLAEFRILRPIGHPKTYRLLAAHIYLVERKDQIVR